MNSTDKAANEPFMEWPKEQSLEQDINECGLGASVIPKMFKSSVAGENTLIL